MFTDIAGNRDENEQVLHANHPLDFKKIYDETMQLLYKVSYRVVNDEEAAEDLAHDSLIKANEKALVFPTINDAKYWLIRVVKNASLNYVKRKQREKKAYEKVLYEDHRAAPSGETAYLKAESMQTAKAALEKLPPHLKEVLVLREYAGLNYKEIGKIVGITEDNVKVRVFRAREKLLTFLEADDVYLS